MGGGQREGGTERERERRGKGGKAGERRGSEGAPSHPPLSLSVSSSLSSPPPSLPLPPSFHPPSPLLLSFLFVPPSLSLPPSHPSSSPSLPPSSTNNYQCHRLRQHKLPPGGLHMQSTYVHSTLPLLPHAQEKNVASYSVSGLWSRVTVM